MKWMRWSWEDLCTAPPEIVHEIVLMMREEQDKLEQDELMRG